MNQHASDATAVQITTLRVNGMACDDCAAHVAGTLEDINGVVHVDVHRRQGTFVVEHLPGFVDAVTIAATIRSLGYGAEVAARALAPVQLDDAHRVFAEQRGLSSSNAAVRVCRAREALKKRVTESCGTCAEHGCLNCSCGQR
jgi:copper chaperone CopZ